MTSNYSPGFTKNMTAADSALLLIGLLQLPAQQLRDMDDRDSVFFRRTHRCFRAVSLEAKHAKVCASCTHCLIGCGIVTIRRRSNGRFRNKVLVVIHCQEMAQENGKVHCHRLDSSTEKTAKTKSLHFQMQMKLGGDGPKNLEA
ncbi:hypothetical protein MTO96_038676 [Rhipicephalus appendiculatus]